MGLQFSPIPDRMYNDYAVFLSYSCPLLCLIIVHLLAQVVCLYIWAVLKLKPPYIIKAEDVAEVGRLLIDESQQQTLIL